MKWVLLVVWSCALGNFLWGQLPGVRLFDYRLQGYEFRFSSDIQQRDRRISGANFNGASSRSTHFGELELYWEGSVYHPNLLMYSLSTNFGLNQNRMMRAGESKPYSKDRGLFQNYAFRGVIFQQKPVNFLLSYRRKYRRLNNNFYEDTEDYSTRWSIQGNWRNPWVPFSTDYSRDQRQEFYGQREINVEEERWGFSGGWGNRQEPNGSFRVNQTSIHRYEIGLYDIKLENLTVMANYAHPFDPVGRNIYQSSLFGSRIVGTDSIINVTWNHLGRVEFNNHVSGSINYNYRYYQTRGSESQSHTVQTEIRHQLYESLTTSGQIRINDYREGPYEKQDLIGVLNWDYTKKLPAGRLFGKLGYEPHQERIRSDHGIQRWGEVLHDFSEVPTVIIPADRVVGESIELYNLEKTVTYVQDLDYQVSPYGTSFIIRRVPGGAIPDSEEVTIRFLYEGNANEETNYTLWNYGLSYEFQSFWGLVIGFNGVRARYPDHARVTWFTQDERSDQSWYIRINYPPVNIDLTRDVSNSTLTPYETRSATVDGILGSYLSQYLLARAQYGIQILPLRDERQEFNSVLLRYFRRFSRDLRGEVSWQQRNVQGNITELKERKWEVVIKYSNPVFSLSLEYHRVNSRFFKEVEFNQQWLARLSLRS